jgi:hypothetical protein
MCYGDNEIGIDSFGDGVVIGMFGCGEVHMHER